MDHNNGGAAMAGVRDAAMALAAILSLAPVVATLVATEPARDAEQAGAMAEAMVLEAPK